MGEQRRNLLYFRAPLVYEWECQLNQYHLIFCPKYRRKVLTGNAEEDLRSILYEVAEESDVEIKAMEIMPDYVHLFISFDSRQAHS